MSKTSLPNYLEELPQVFAKLAQSDMNPADWTEFILMAGRVFKQGLGRSFDEVETVIRENVPDLVLVNREYLEGLKQEAEWLNCLEQAGVDNWSGIEQAYIIQHDTKE